MEEPPESSTLEEALGQLQRSLRGELPPESCTSPFGDQGLVGGSWPGALPHTPMGLTPARTRRKKMGVAVIFEDRRKFAFTINLWCFP